MDLFTPNLDEYRNLRRVLCAQANQLLDRADDAAVLALHDIVSELYSYCAVCAAPLAAYRGAHCLECGAVQDWVLN